MRSKTTGDDSDWQYFKNPGAGGPDLSKIGFKLDKSQDGWQCACFKNGSDKINVELEVSISGQNIGEIKPPKGGNGKVCMTLNPGTYEVIFYEMVGSPFTVAVNQGMKFTFAA